jgi:hypothetical protein
MDVSTQNMSHAVMAQRHEAADSPDDFPTPPWATRALVEHVLYPEDKVTAEKLSCHEPACGRGHMAAALEEYFGHVISSDIHAYGYGALANYLEAPSVPSDWVITNPPFKLAEQFIIKALETARVGVAMLTRTVFIESVGRYERLFNVSPPTYVAQFVERVPMVRGRLDKKASTATGYAWIIWTKESGSFQQKDSCTEMVWIPPCRRSLEREADYADPVERKVKALAPVELTLAL